MLMDRGQLMMEGKTEDVVNAYMYKGAELAMSGLSDRSDRSGEGKVRITSIDLRDPSGSIIGEAIAGSDVIVSLAYAVKPDVVLNDCIVCVELAKDLKTYFALSSALVDTRKLQLSGEGRIDFMIRDWPLSGGSYHVNIYVESDLVTQDFLNDASVIEVIDGDFYGSGKLVHSGWQGTSVLVKHSWNLVEH
jgi:lipopolysaccharide transport system ATP-binding protein